VHRCIEKSYGWFVGVRECTGTSKVLQHGLGVRECALARRKGPRMVCGGPRVHWHTKVLQHGLESASVHWHVEKAYGWFVGVHECIGTSKVLQHGLGVRECALARRKGPVTVYGNPQLGVHTHRRLSWKALPTV